MSAFKQTNIQYTQEIERTLFYLDETGQNVLARFILLRPIKKRSFNLLWFFCFVLFCFRKLAVSSVSDLF